MEEVHKMAEIGLRIQAEQDKKTQESVEPSRTATTPVVLSHDQRPPSDIPPLLSSVDPTRPIPKKRGLRYPFVDGGVSSIGIRHQSQIHPPRFLALHISQTGLMKLTMTPKALQKTERSILRLLNYFLHQTTMNMVRSRSLPLKWRGYTLLQRCHRNYQRYRTSQATATETCSFGCSEQTLSVLEETLGIRPVTTASSGYCLAIALAQEVADHDMAALDDTLETITACIKRGIYRTEKLNLDEKFGH
uniref:Uncharacterized protein n=1 Tax=Peronospora matthiolae TaxID=2874970 RepID=A0AAV1UN26_9STRA